MNPEFKKFIEDNFLVPSKALDLGAGSGGDVEGLKNLGWETEGVDLKTGTDLEEEYLSEKGPFDLVYSNYVLHYLKNKKALIKSAHDNLKTEGWFFFHDLIRSELTTEMYLSQEEIEEMIKAEGFEILESNIFSFFDDKPDHRHYHDVVEIHAKKK
ncbi:MAG TPA: class I SAM-dependent methyltransferase [Candidatus Paceibacterota bacterium]|nr:class I SAM-dependent methyltransferase [Candidatus Paceibacterota bacterium]